MTPPSWYSLIATASILLLELGVIARVLLRPHREPASRIAWVVVIVALPAFGMLIYLFFGEVNIGRRRIEKMRAVLKSMPPMADAVEADRHRLEAEVPERHRHLFGLGRSISGFERPVARAEVSAWPVSRRLWNNAMAMLGPVL